MLVELSVVEQRYRIVLAVLEDRPSVTDAPTSPTLPRCRVVAQRASGS
jgi:hypothetical protein